MRTRQVMTAALLCASLVVAQSTRPGELSDAELAKKAKAGDGDAAFTLAERLADKDPKAAQQMIALAAKNGHVGALKMMLAKNRKADGKPVDKQQEIMLLRRLVTAGSAEHHKQLRDASPDAYWSVAKEALPKTDVMDRSLLNQPQEFDVTFRDDGVEGEREKVAGKATKTVPLTIKDVKDFKPKDGRFARVAGYTADDGKFHVLAVRQPEPTYAYEGRLVPKGVAAGREQKYEVVVTVKNTGKQPIEKLKLTVRCYQQSSPNDGKTTVEFTNVLPGKVEDQTVTFEMYNFQYMGRTSIPKVDVRPAGMAW